jgi:hypothetical protein
VRIQLVLKCTEARVTHFVLGLVAALSLLINPIPLLHAEIQAAPEKKNQGELHPAKNPVAPPKVANPEYDELATKRYDSCADQ